MSTKSGKLTQRRVVFHNHKGYDIVQVTVKHYWKSPYSNYYTDIVDKTEKYFTFCLHGEANRPSMAYNLYPAPKTIDEVKECIDKFIEDDSLYFTEGEREKYVYKPNKKCEYAYGYDSLMKIMREHQKASKRIKILLEDRLEDANFHAECAYLANHDYEGFEAFVTKDNTFNEKFEVYTMTQRKRIKDPKSLEEGLNKAIEDYLASQGIKDTSVKVKFCEEW